MNLRICPWCGSDDHEWGEASTGTMGDGFFGECSECGFMITGPTQLSVQVPWNNASEVSHGAALMETPPSG